MKRKDVLIIGGVLLTALVLLIVGRLQTARVTEGALPTLTITNAEELHAGEALAEADSYLRIKQGDAYYHLVPLNGPGQIVIHQDKGQENVIHINKNSVVMHSANCPNHDCMRQGEMTLDNIEYRVFQSWITCLPHQLSLELIPREQAKALVEAKP
ncbi:MAG: NusG domain II-containing protein [Christensenellales bacterium]